MTEGGEGGGGGGLVGRGGGGELVGRGGGGELVGSEGWIISCLFMHCPSSPAHPFLCELSLSIACRHHAVGSVCCAQSV